MALTTREDAWSATVWARSATLWLTSSSRVSRPLSVMKRSISSGFAACGAAWAVVAQARRSMQSHRDMGAKGNTQRLLIENNHLCKPLISLKYIKTPGFPRDHKALEAPAGTLRRCPSGVARGRGGFHRFF